MKVIKINTEENDVGKRLDVILRKYCPNISRNKLIKLIKNKQVSLDNKLVSAPSFIINNIYKIIINMDLLKYEEKKKNVKLNIIMEDDHLIVLNKPPGILTHDTDANRNNSIVNLLKEKNIKLAFANEKYKDGVVHRLDKDTSGLIIFAKDSFSQLRLFKQFYKREVIKLYDAVCYSVPIPVAGTINRPIVDYINRKKVSLHKKGKEAITEYKVKKCLKDMFSLVECKILTGRTHQIRVHMQAMNCPLIGDQLYSRGRNLPSKLSTDISLIIKHFKRQALHSKSLTFKHPIYKKTINLSCEKPEDMLELESALFEGF